MTKKTKTIILLLLIILVLGFVFYKLFFDKNIPYKGEFKSDNKKITISDDDLEYELIGINQETIEEILSDNKIIINSQDFVFPDKNSKLYGSTKIIIKRNKTVIIGVDGKKVEGSTLGNNVAMAIWDNKIKMREDDFTLPGIEFPIKNNAKIEVVRVDINEEIVKKEVDFEKKFTDDEKLSWRIKNVSQKGVKGIDEYKYRVVSHNGKEISRKLLLKERTKDPVEEISVQGTYMKLGKANKGQGTWYAFKGGLFAASTTIPRGAYAKVTNTANGQAVVVQINDYGPQGKGRIIDLDKVAFEKIASLGAGVINVKVEQVLN